MTSVRISCTVKPLTYVLTRLSVASMAVSFLHKMPTVKAKKENSTFGQLTKSSTLYQPADAELAMQIYGLKPEGNLKIPDAKRKKHSTHR